MKLTAVFEHWHLGDGNYPALAVGDEVRLSRPTIPAQFVGRQTEDGLDTLPTRAAEADRSTLIADIPFPAPGNVAAKRCAVGGAESAATFNEGEGSSRLWLEEVEYDVAP